MIGRGSSDPAAAAQLRSFTEATLADAGAERPRRVEFGFVAAARPRFDEAIVAACDPADVSVRRIIVQPHLLFRGHVEDQVADAVEATSSGSRCLAWVPIPSSPRHLAAV
jgi:sirohydrochlorin ferrochelatase